MWHTAAQQLEPGMPARLVFSLALVLLGGACSFDHLRYKSPTLSEGGKGVVVLEEGATPPPECRYLRHTSTNNIQGDPQYMRIKLANNAAKYGGNLLLLTTFNRLTSEGAVYLCPTRVLPGRPEQPTQQSATTPTAASPAPDDELPPPPPPAGEDDAAPAPRGPDNASLDAEARGIFLAGKAAYGDARYEDALRHFKRAYELSKRPVLLFNIGQAADKLRRDQEALDAFKGYLEQVPDGEGKREAESRVRVLEQVIEGKQGAR
jgi:tetratricopeptide (TPR) repeat protein